MTVIRIENDITLHFSLGANRHFRRTFEECNCFKKMRKLTTAEFINRAKVIHGDKYDYNLVDYKGRKTKVKIICPVHGIIEQSPESHLSGKGCQKCYHNRRTASVFGIGVNDMDMEGCNKAIEYKRWCNMLFRCTDKCSNKFSTYYGCKVCREWQQFSNFYDWFRDPKNGYRAGYELDKDLLIKGNKLYSPKTCCFIPHTLNSLLNRHKGKGRQYPIGVTRIASGRFASRLNRYGKSLTLGTFDTIEEAFSVYKEAREEYIKEIATSYYERGEITKRVYDALMRYEVEVTD